jgi:polysaccharide biosynthesis protein PslL
MTSRNSTIDVAKGIGIFFVVLGHNWLSTHEKSELSRVIFSFHMPLFFFLAGIFLRTSDGILHFAKTRASSLLRPYFVVLTILGIVKMLQSTADSEIGMNGLDYFMGMLYGTGNTIAWIALWFLPHLFISLIASLMILKAIETRTGHKGWMILAALTLLTIGISFIDTFWRPAATDISFVGPGRFLGLPWSADLVPITSSFIIFGYLLADPVKSMRFSLGGLFTSLVVFVLLHYYFDDSMDLNERAYGNPIVSTILAFAGIYITFSIASLLQNFPSFKKPLAYLGSGTLFVLIFHDPLQTRAFDTLSQISPHVYLNIIGSLVWSIAVSLLLWELAKRQKLMGRLLLPNKPGLAPADRSQSNHFKARIGV